MEVDVLDKRRFLLITLLIILFLSTAAAATPSRIHAASRIWDQTETIYLDEIPSLVRRARGSVVFLRIYAMYCPYCTQEISILNRYANEFSTHDITVINICRDKTRDDLNNLLNNHQIYFKPYWLQYCEKQRLISMVQQLGGDYTGSIPYTLLFDRSGKPRYEWTGAYGFETYHKRVLELLKH